MITPDSFPDSAEGADVITLWVPRRGASMKTRLVRIGNSRGVRIPKAMLEQVGLEDELEMRVEEGALVISPVAAARAGWAEAVVKFGPSRLLDAPSTTRFDDEEWAW